MKKRTVVMLGALVISLLLSSCSGKSASIHDGYQNIAKDRDSYQFFVPDTWIADTSDGITAAYVSDKDRSSVSFMAFDISDAIIQVSPVGGNQVDKTETSADTQTIASDSETEKKETIDPAKITTIDEYWDYYSGIFADTFSDLSYVKNGENRTLNGKAAKTYVYDATITGIPCRIMQVVSLDKGTVYLFTYTASQDTFDDHTEDIDEILSFIEW